jgi:hypothetical protein
MKVEGAIGKWNCAKGRGKKMREHNEGKYDQSRSYA